MIPGIAARPPTPGFPAGFMGVFGSMTISSDNKPVLSIFVSISLTSPCAESNS